jgi:hypothetical protein
MRKSQVGIVLFCCLIAGVMFSGAQTKKHEIATRRAGLWEITTNMTWQQSPFMAGAMNGMAEGGKHTKLVCLTQEMIDKYGALLPQSRGQCHIANKVMRLGGETAEWVCTGRMSGTGALETNWTDLEHATGKLHFVGTFHGGAQTFPIEWTTDSTSGFKREDCGSVTPMPLPQARP